MPKQPVPNSLLALANATGISSMLGIASLFTIAVAIRVSGVFGPVAHKTTVDRLLSTPLVPIALLAVILVGSASVLLCRAELRPILGSFLAGFLWCAALVSAMVFDPWLSVVLAAMASPVLLKAKSAMPSVTSPSQRSDA